MSKDKKLPKKDSRESSVSDENDAVQPVAPPDSGDKAAIEELKEKTKVKDEVKSLDEIVKTLNPFDAVIETAEKSLEKRTKHFTCLKEGLPRAFVSCGPFTVSAFSAKLIDTGTGWMELSAPTPGQFISYTDDQHEAFIEEVKARVVVWEDNDRVRCTIYKNDYKHKQPGYSAEPLAKYVVFEKSDQMTAEQVLEPDKMPTMYDKAEDELSTKIA